MRFVSSYEVLAAVFASLDVNDADVAMLLVMMIIIDNNDDQYNR